MGFMSGNHDAIPVPRGSGMAPVVKVPVVEGTAVVLLLLLQLAKKLSTFSCVRSFVGSSGVRAP